MQQRKRWIASVALLGILTLPLSVFAVTEEGKLVGNVSAGASGNVVVLGFSLLPPTDSQASCPVSGGFITIPNNNAAKYWFSQLLAAKAARMPVSVSYTMDVGFGTCTLTSVNLDEES